MILRSILPEAQFCLTQFRALCISGPRQSGKTTLSKQLFKGKPYVNFENPDVQLDAETNPRAFLNKYKNGAVFDEIQRVPDLFRYLQEMLDKNTKRGQFILTGSNNFLLQEQVSQSLAGRAGYLTLLPLSYAELQQSKFKEDDVDNLMLNGGYPEIWNEKLNADTWYKSYFSTYVQRDVRLLKNITNIAAFQKLLLLSANYAGQILNRDEMAKLVGVDTKTILSWLGVLETSYIIFLLQPWHNNLNKRLTKSPKLYFYDTGLLCSLLNIKSTTALKRHNAYGSIFENWVIAEVKKNRANDAQINGMYFFRDSIGNEVDLIVENEEGPKAIEIKAANKLQSDSTKGLRFWQKNQRNAPGILLYKGEKSEALTDYLSIENWRIISDIS